MQAMATDSSVTRLLRRLGLAIGVAGLVFVISRLVSDWEAVSDALRHARQPLLLLALLAGLASMSSIGLVWRGILHHLGSRLTAGDSLHRYFVGQLGKYVPGGIWPVVGRAEMARRSGVGGRVAYLSTVYSLVATYAGALATAAIASLPLTQEPAGWWWSPWLLPGLILGVLLLHPRVLTGVIGWVRRFAPSVETIPIPRWIEAIRTVVVHVPAWVGISVATWLVVSAYGGTTPLPALLVVTPLAWLAGFVVVASPGGLGVREAVFVAVITPWDPELAAAIALTARLVFVLVDLIGAGLSTVFRIGSQRNTET